MNPISKLPNEPNTKPLNKTASFVACIWHFFSLSVSGILNILHAFPKAKSLLLPLARVFGFEPWCMRSKAARTLTDFPVVETTKFFFGVKSGWNFLVHQLAAHLHLPTRPDKSFCYLAQSDIARQTPISSQTCLNSPHTSRLDKIFVPPTKKTFGIEKLDG